GCPDTDKDGVVDIDDKCPKVAGPASNFGCPPDKDNDGYPDATDPCPDLAGTINGCPDTDGDGITDNLDKCPNTKGIAALMGCPEIKMEDKKVLDIAMRAVQFQTGTAVITKSSYKNLNDVLVVLNKYPEMNLSIEGHTDSVADDALNQKLSEKRAKACMDYLIKKGINVSRLMSAGYGETKPVGDNKTRDGRQLNRRTEFNPVWR
ncbi:MAG: OmpA family protein, partial [Saprospiraceae bacterium]